MDPELAQSIADENGLPIEHFPDDGYSVVHTPSGPVHIAHPPATLMSDAPTTRPIQTRTPAATRPSSGAPTPITTRDLPAREGVPAALARPPAPAVTAPPLLTPEMQRTRDAMREAQIGRIQQEAQQELADIERESGYSVSDPDQFGISTRTYPDGRTQRFADSPEAFHREAAARQAAEAERLRHTPTGAGTTTFADGTRVVTDANGHTIEQTSPGSRVREGGPAIDMSSPLALEMATVGPQQLSGVPESASTGDIPEGTPASWLVQPEDPTAGLRETARLGEIPMSSQVTAPPIYAPSPQGPPAPQGPTLEGGYLGGPTPPTATPQPRRVPSVPRPISGAGVTTTATPAGPPLPPAASDELIAGLAGPHAAPRREPDFIDRQMLHEQQVAQAGREDAVRQMAAEQQIEQQRQQDEADRRRAMQGAQQSYQRAIDRVANAHLDPGHWFADQGVAGTIAATLAVSLGALGQALGGTDSNLALAEINQAVDRDIAAQQADIESGRAAADMQGNMIGIMRSEFNDRDAAREAARAAMLRQVALQTQAHTADLADDEARLHAEQMRQELLAAAAEADRAAMTAEMNWQEQAARIARLQAQAAHEQRLAHPGPGRPHAPSVGIMNAFRDWMALHPGASTEDGWAIVGGEGPPPTSTASPADVQAITATDSALSALERQVGPLSQAAEGGISGVGMADSRIPHFLVGEQGRRLRQRASNTLESFLHLQSGAAVSDSEFSRAEQRYGFAAGSTEEEFLEGLRSLRAELDARRSGMVGTGSAVDSDYDALGFTPDE